MEERVKKLRQLLEIDQKEAEIEKIEYKMSSNDFWLERDSGKVADRLQNLKSEVKKFNDLYQLIEMSEGENIEGLEEELIELENVARFSGKYDQNSAIINFYAGAGGDDAQDWTEMLMRMYLRWAEKKGYRVKVLNQSRGKIAGVKSATIKIDGTCMYGKLKGESGVHRLVRQSPFNAKNLRQTSFSLVEVIPEIEESSGEIEIPEKDLKIDVFRSSGHGGQSVNTTDSAVRITHISTNITVTCQNEKSQLQNKKMALTVLKSRLAKVMEDQQKEKIEEIRGGNAEPEWGSQIRSYILHPYKLVKDHRMGKEDKNPVAVLDGELSNFIG